MAVVIVILVVTIESAPLVEPVISIAGFCATIGAAPAGASAARQNEAVTMGFIKLLNIPNSSCRITKWPFTISTR
jgi:hypothetical protein